MVRAVVVKRLQRRGAKTQRAQKGFLTNKDFAYFASSRLCVGFSTGAAQEGHSNHPSTNDNDTMANRLPMNTMEATRLGSCPYFSATM